MVIIRDYSPLDYPHVRRNLEEAGIFYDTRDSEDNYAAIANSEDGMILVAELGDEVAGNMIAQMQGINVGMIWALAVAKRYRQQGIATELLSTAEHQLRTRGAKEVWGFVQTTNDKSQRMLKKAGYETDYDHKFFGPYKEL
jgi:ribosomal protein S18 acetylase RimI-like enzyme